MFARFARMAEHGLHSANVMAAIEIVDLPTKWWIVMPFCDGESLFELVDVSGPQPEPTAQHLMRQASEGGRRSPCLVLPHPLAHARPCPGLAFLHDSHLAHLDISPENILVTRAHHVWVRMLLSWSTGPVAVCWEDRLTHASRALLCLFRGPQVTDFGAATPVAAGELLERYRVGKLSTMAPEVSAAARA